MVGMWEALDGREKLIKIKNSDDEELDRLIEALPTEEAQKIKKVREEKVRRWSFSELDRENLDQEEIVEEKEKDEKFEYVHFTIVEEELSAIWTAVNDHVRSSRNRERKQRTENIYILTAIGIIGGFLNYNPSLSINTVFQTVALGFALGSSLFLFVKIMSVSGSRINTKSRWNYIDDLADKIFPGVITGVFIIGAFLFISDYYQIELSYIMQFVFAGLSLIVAAFSSYTSIHNSSEDGSELSYNELVDSLFEIPADKEEEQKKNLENFINQLEGASTLKVTKKDLKKLKSRSSMIEGLSGKEVEEIQDNINKLIEEENKRNMTQEELHEMRISELKQVRERHIPDIEE